jgi:hypothetical protein
MHVKVDEDLPAAISQLRRAAGHEAATVLQRGLGGWKDAEIWKAVKAEQRFDFTQKRHPFPDEWISNGSARRSTNRQPRRCRYWPPAASSAPR